MSTSQNDVLNYFQKLLSPELFEDYAPNGLQIAGAPQIQRVAFAVSATQDSIEKSLDWKAQALVVHHGVFWKHQGVRTITGPWGERVKKCLKQDLNLFAYHLPLDAHPTIGNAAALAQELGLRELSPFALYKKQPMGVKGYFPKSLSARDFKEVLENILHHPVLLATPDENRPLKSLGIITGGANNEWARAVEDGLDAYLTGEISEYNWHDSIEAGIHYFAGGHHATERFGILALMKKMQTDFPNLEVQFFDSPNLA